MQTVWDDAANTCGNPCPVLDRDTGTLWLLLTWNRGDDHEPRIIARQSKDTRRVFVTSSTNDGLSWAKPREITADVKPTNWTWPASRLLEPRPSAYSCLAVFPDGSIGLLYEAGPKKPYENLVFARFNLEWLADGKTRVDNAMRPNCS